MFHSQVRVEFTDVPLELVCLHEQQELFLAEDTSVKEVVASVACLSSNSKQDITYNLLTDSGETLS